MNIHSLALTTVLAAAPFAVRADANPDFDDDAKPILRMQPGLLEYVEQRFDVKETGTAKFPGDDDRAPAPPYIFRARPIGSHGAFYLRLLIQPGQPGHILGVVDMHKVHLKTPPDEPFGPAPGQQAPATAQTPPPQAQPAPANPAVQVPELSAGPVEQQPASSQPPQQAAPPAPASQGQPNEPTADTPSGPIQDDSGSSSNSNSSAQPSLAPPPDPAPPAR